MKETVECIIHNSRGEILMQKKTSDAPFFANGWLLFGGGIENGEFAIRAIDRELYEELGLCFASIQRYGLGSIDKKNKKKVYTFVTQLEDVSKIRLTEGAGFAFYNIREIRKLKTFPRIIKLLEGWHKEWKSQ